LFPSENERSLGSLNSAKSVLVEGTLELLKQKGPTAFSFTEEPSLEQCFGQLLDSTSPSNGAEVPKIDENAWRNVADAVSTTTTIIIKN